jgi:hypothetical protein
MFLFMRFSCEIQLISIKIQSESCKFPVFQIVPKRIQKSTSMDPCFAAPKCNAQTHRHDQRLRAILFAQRRTPDAIGAVAWCRHAMPSAFTPSSSLFSHPLQDGA